jgi:ketosteroid isomerase-like protein
MDMRTFLCWALVGLTVSFAAAQNDSDSAVQSKITALEKAWNQAYKLGDRRGLDRILDDRIVLINDDGSVLSKADFLRTVKPSNSHEEQVTPESISVRVFDNVAVATGVFEARGVDGGKRYVRRERFVDTWLRKGDNWACVATNATPILH